MPLANKYTKTAVFLHWSIALLMIGNCLLALLFQFISDENIRLAIDTHKSFGITVLGLVVLRVLWRVSHPAPPLPSNHARLEILGAKLGHAALYVLMIALPLSGWMHDSAWKDAAAHPMSLFWSIPWPRISMIANIEAVSKEHLHELFGQLHIISSYVLYGVLALHIAGALKHQYFDQHSDKGRGMLPRPLPNSRTRENAT